MSASPILLYHQVVDAGPQDIHAVSAQAFAAQMHWLYEHQYRGVTVESLFAENDRASDNANSRRVAITFDDGYLDNFSNALPILKSYGFQATVFLVAGRVGSVNDWDRSPYLAGAPLLSWPHAQEMMENGISFGAHTSTHPDLTAISVQQAAQEVATSRMLIERQLRTPVQSFAYPFSRYNQPIVSIVSESGYNLACTYVPGHVGGAGRRPFELQRICILATDSLQDFAGKIEATLPWRLRKYWRTVRRRLKQ